jgi:hypothetical protein
VMLFAFRFLSSIFPFLCHFFPFPAFKFRFLNDLFQGLRERFSHCNSNLEPGQVSTAFPIITHTTLV